MLQLQPLERFRNGWVYFLSVFNSKFLSQNVKPLLACQAQPAFSHSSGSNLVSVIHSPQLLLIEISSFIFHSLSAIPTPLSMPEEHETYEIEARK